MVLPGRTFDDPKIKHLTFAPTWPRPRGGAFVQMGPDRPIDCRAKDEMIAYSSQFGQDGFLDRIVYRGFTGGVFVDVGAHDGEQFSNYLNRRSPFFSPALERKVRWLRAVGRIERRLRRLGLFTERPARFPFKKPT